MFFSRHCYTNIIQHNKCVSSQSTFIRLNRFKVTLFFYPHLICTITIHTLSIFILYTTNVSISIRDIVLRYHKTASSFSTINLSWCQVRGDVITWKPTWTMTMLIQEGGRPCCDELWLLASADDTSIGQVSHRKITPRRCYVALVKTTLHPVADVSTLPVVVTVVREFLLLIASVVHIFVLNWQLQSIELQQNGCLVRLQLAILGWIF